MAKRPTVRKPAATKNTAKKGAVPAKSASKSEADPRFEPVARAFARTAGFSLMESKSKGMRGLMQNGKSFGMSMDGRIILKLPEARVAALLADGTGEPFRHGPRVMKGWIEITDPKADWVALAREAQRAAVAGAKGRRG